MSEMNYLAMILGYSVMAIAGVLVVALGYVYAVDRAHRSIRNKIAWRDMREAIAEWKVKHPDRAKRYDDGYKDVK